MKKIIISTICLFLGSINLNAQSKSTFHSSDEIQVNVKSSAISTLSSSEFGVASFVMSPKVKSVLKKVSSTPIENAGKSLVKGGKYLYWGTIATAVGQILVLTGEPVSGTLLSLAGTIFIYSGYQQITIAGRQLQQTESN